MYVTRGGSEKRSYKRGVSGVVTTLILIGLSILALLIIWASISDFIKKEVNKSEKCFKVIDKVTLNKQKTCYNPITKQVHFFVEVGDVEIDGLLVGISSDKVGKSFVIRKEGVRIDGVSMYNGSELIILPEKEGGLEYVYNTEQINNENTENFYPRILQISPIIGQFQCDVSDTMNEIDVCSA
ncbi:MAG: hypothetical protein QXU40_00635 [Candidatus Pacearchaeota archaeon]